MTVQLYHGDCLEIMPTLEAGSFDAIIADLPYGTTACKWDTVIPFAPLWAEYKRLIKPRGAIVLFGSQPFTSLLVTSNLEWFRYAWYWYKNLPSGFQFAKSQPMRAIEEICVFSKQQCAYNEQRTASVIADRKVTPGRSNGAKSLAAREDHWISMDKLGYVFPETVAPRNVLEIPCVPHATGTLHPTQKPVALLEYLVRTYTNPGDVVLDNVMGSGTTGVACAHTGRRFVGIEKDAGYFEIAKRRVETAQLPLLEVTA